MRTGARCWHGTFAGDAPGMRDIRHATRAAAVRADDRALGGTEGLRLMHGQIPGLEKRVSRVIYGTLFLHRLPDDDAAFALLDGVWRTGCNAFDCAAIYGGGQCEARLGRWLRARRIARDDVVIITKGGCEGQDQLWRPNIGEHDRVREELDGSLARLGVDRIDCYLLHRDDPDLPVETIVAFMHSLVADGKVSAWGVSNWATHRLQAPRSRAEIPHRVAGYMSHAVPPQAALHYAQRAGLSPPVVDSPQESLAEPCRSVWPNTTFMSDERRRAWRDATKGQVVLLGWECLAKGFMCGKWSRADGQNLAEVRLSDETAAEWREMQLRIAYCNDKNFDRRDRAAALAAEKGVTLPEVAIGYVLSQSESSFALVGTTSLAHFEQATDPLPLPHP